MSRLLAQEYWCRDARRLSAVSKGEGETLCVRRVHDCDLKCHTVDLLHLADAVEYGTLGKLGLDDLFLASVICVAICGHRLISIRDGNGERGDGWLFNSGRL